MHLPGALYNKDHRPTPSSIMRAGSRGLINLSISHLLSTRGYPSSLGYRALIIFLFHNFLDTAIILILVNPFSFYYHL